MFLENETKSIFDKKLLKSNIPKCKKSLKNIPFPNNKYIKNVKSLKPIRKSSTLSLKDENNISKKYSPEYNFQMMFKKSLISSFQRSINKIPKYNVKKRINSTEKFKNIFSDNSFSYKKNQIKIEHIHNFKIQYLLLKENINKIYNQENIPLDIKNQMMEEIKTKLITIFKKTNEYIKHKNFEEKNKIFENNQKMLNIYSEKYKTRLKKLQKINNNEYIDNINNQIKEIEKEINLYEKENEELLNNNKNEIFLPNIQKLKSDQDLILDRQLQNKINEYKDKIIQEISISKKIKDNEINIRELEEIISNLKEKNCSEEYSSDNKTNNIIYNNNTDFLDLDEDIYNFNKKKKLSNLNELISLKSEYSSNVNHTTSSNKESKNRIITDENQSKKEDNKNIFILPFTTKRKNLSSSNITVDDNNIKNNRKIKEIILKNLDRKEKEEKALINSHENDNSSIYKYKHIKLKPNFSFNNDYYKFKEDKFNKNKFTKFQSSAEITNLNTNNNENNDKEELIKESIVNDSSNKNNENNNAINNININDKNWKFNRNKRIKDINGINMETVNKIYNEINKANNTQDIKKERFCTSNEQREKVLNTIMYDDL